MEMADFLSYFFSAQLQAQLFFFKIAFLIFSLFLAGSIILLLRKGDWLKYALGYNWLEFSTYKPSQAIALIRRWQKIEKRMLSQWESEIKLAILEADQLLDEVLERMGYQGATLTEKLEGLDESVLPNLKDVWQAHHLREDIVHDPDYKLLPLKAKGAIAIFEQAFKHLEIL